VFAHIRTSVPRVWALYTPLSCVTSLCIHRWPLRQWHCIPWSGCHTHCVYALPWQHQCVYPQVTPVSTCTPVWGLYTPFSCVTIITWPRSWLRHTRTTMTKHCSKRPAKSSSLWFRASPTTVTIHKNHLLHLRTIKSYVDKSHRVGAITFYSNPRFY